MSPRGALLLPGHPRSVTLREEALTLTPAGTALLPYWKAENITDTSGKSSLLLVLTSSMQDLFFPIRKNVRKVPVKIAHSL